MFARSIIIMRHTNFVLVQLLIKYIGERLCLLEAHAVHKLCPGPSSVILLVLWLEVVFSQVGVRPTAREHKHRTSVWAVLVMLC